MWLLPPRLPARAPLAVLLAAALASCAEPPPSTGDLATEAVEAPDSATGEGPADAVDVQGVSRAVAEIEPVGPGRASGTVTLAAVDGGVRVRAELDGLSRDGYHALQVLDGRGCDADPDRHLGLGGAPHGGPYSPPGLRHAGDLGSIRGDGGRGRYDRVDPVLSLSGTASAAGRAVVVRALRDDAASPGGAAGDVIGCGVLRPS